MHVHVNQDEGGEVISGQLSAIVDGKSITLGPGERAFFPRGVRHRWWNAGDEPLVVKGTAEPAGDLDQFLAGIFEIINASASGRPSPFYIAHLSLRHPSQRLSPAPAWVDRIVFRIIVAIGTVVGAYRRRPAAGAGRRRRGRRLRCAGGQGEDGAGGDDEGAGRHGRSPRVEALGCLGAPVAQSLVGL